MKNRGLIIDRRTVQSLKVGNYYRISIGFKLQFSSKKYKNMALYGYFPLTKDIVKRCKKLLKTENRKYYTVNPEKIKKAKKLLIRTKK